MDFEPVPAGTLPPAALVLRGSDPNLAVPTANSLNTSLGVSLHAVNAAGGQRHLKYSGVSGLIAGAFFTRDPAVLQSLLHGAVPSPAKLRALWTYLTANGIDATAPRTPEHIVETIEAIVATWVTAAVVPPEAILVVADLTTRGPRSRGSPPRRWRRYTRATGW